MMIAKNYTTDELYAFISRASAATYAGGGSYEKVVERPGFLEMVYRDNNWHYRDSYTGFYRSSGSEVVRYQNRVVWVSNYCGGMAKGKETLASEVFNFLKKAMLAKPSNKQSSRGPDHFEEGVWQYSYQQKGDVLSFSGYEEITKDGTPVFSHEIIGGIIVGKQS
jgi:hypothetical protein